VRLFVAVLFVFVAGCAGCRSSSERATEATVAGYQDVVACCGAVETVDEPD
jgi:hypothetical protein